MKKLTAAVMLVALAVLPAIAGNTGYQGDSIENVGSPGYIYSGGLDMNYTVNDFATDPSSDPIEVMGGSAQVFITGAVQYDAVRVGESDDQDITYNFTIRLDVSDGMGGWNEVQSWESGDQVVSTGDFDIWDFTSTDPDSITCTTGDYQIVVHATMIGEHDTGSHEFDEFIVYTFTVQEMCN